MGGGVLQRCWPYCSEFQCDFVVVALGLGVGLELLWMGLYILFLSFSKSSQCNLGKNGEGKKTGTDYE